MILNPNRYYTKQEYLAFENASEEKHEYVDGRIIPLHRPYEPPPDVGITPAHIMLRDNVASILKARLGDGSQKVLPGHFEVQLAEPGKSVCPDLVVAQLAEGSAGQSKCSTVPVLVVEVLSPTTELDDRCDKFDLYRHLTTITDYLLIAQDMLRVEHFTRQEVNRWLYRPLEIPDAIIDLPSINCRLHLSEIYVRVEIPPPAITPR